MHQQQKKPSKLQSGNSYHKDFAIYLSEKGLKKIKRKIKSIQTCHYHMTQKFQIQRNENLGSLGNLYINVQSSFVC